MEEMMKRALCVFLASLMFIPALANEDDEVRIKFLKKQLVQKGFSANEVERLFQDKRLKKLQLRPPIAKKIKWSELEGQILSPESIGRGRDFSSRNHHVLKTAENNFGVAKEILTGLVRLETNLGQYLGDHTAINIFYTKLLIAKHWSGPAENFVALCAYCRQSRMDYFKIKGSYAGAVGLVQFLPVNFEVYGIDGNGDGMIDLFDPRDAIPSSANYLVRHGWKKDNLKALNRYYGDPTSRYAEIILKYAKALVR